MILGPVILFTGLALLLVGCSAGTLILMIFSIMLLPVLLPGCVLYVCYMAGRWAYGVVFRGEIGSGNRVLMKPEGWAVGNEAHGHLEFNLIKIQENTESDETGVQRERPGQ